MLPKNNTSKILGKFIFNEQGRNLLKAKDWSDSEIDNLSPFNIYLKEDKIGFTENKYTNISLKFLHDFFIKVEDPKYKNFLDKLKSLTNEFSNT